MKKMKDPREKGFKFFLSKEEAAMFLTVCKRKGQPISKVVRETLQKVFGLKRTTGEK